MWCLMVSALSADFLPLVDNFIRGENLVFGLQVFGYNPCKESVRIERTTIRLTDPPTVIFSIEDPAAYTFVCETNTHAFAFIGAFQMSSRQLNTMLSLQGLSATKPQAKLTFINVETQSERSFAKAA